MRYKEATTNTCGNSILLLAVGHQCGDKDVERAFGNEYHVCDIKKVQRSNRTLRKILLSQMTSPTTIGRALEMESLRT